MLPVSCMVKTWEKTRTQQSYENSHRVQQTHTMFGTFEPGGASNWYNITVSFGLSALACRFFCDPVFRTSLLKASEAAKAVQTAATTVVRGMPAMAKEFVVCWRDISVGLTNDNVKSGKQMTTVEMIYCKRTAPEKCCEVKCSDRWLNGNHNGSVADFIPDD